MRILLTIIAIKLAIFLSVKADARILAQANWRVTKGYTAVKDIYIVDTKGEAYNCTAFLISKNLLVTNQHCVQDAVSVRIVGGEDCSNLLAINEKLDYALLKCKGEPGRDGGFFKVSYNVTKAAKIVHFNCYDGTSSCKDRQRLVSPAITYEVKKYPYMLDHTGDTLNGSSGGAILNKNNEVIGLHFGSFKALRVNSGTKIGPILDDMIKQTQGSK